MPISPTSLAHRLDTIAGRSILVSVVVIALFHAFSLWSYERALDRELTLAYEARLAERILSIKRSVLGVVPDQRDKVAHELSGGSIEVHWSEKQGAVPGGQGVDRWLGLATQLRDQAPELPAEDIIVGATAGADPHIALVSVRLPDATWINVGLFAPERPLASGRGVLVSTSTIMFGIVILAVLLARWLASPIRSVAEAARAISPDAPVVALAARGPREVRDLAIAFNEMQARITDLVARRTQSLVAVSHDLRTPLTRLELRLEDIPDASLRDAIANDIGEMETMIETTLSYLKGENSSEPIRPLDLNSLLATIVDDARDMGRDAKLEATAMVVVEGRRSGLKRAFSNLIGNALRFGDRVNVELDVAGTAAIVTIEDNGPGIPPDKLDAVLEPFVRLESSRNRMTGGVGLGLTIAKANIEAHGGRLKLSNRPEGGLRVQVTLPATVL